MTEIPAKTPRPIGRTDSFFPGKTNAAAAVADSWAAAADPEAAAAEGVGVPPVSASAVVVVGASVVAVTDGAGELVVVPVTLGVDVSVEPEADVLGDPATTTEALPVAVTEAEEEVAVCDTGTDEIPLTTIGGLCVTVAVGVAESVAVAVPLVEVTVMEDDESVLAEVAAVEGVEEAVSVTDTVEDVAVDVDTTVEVATAVVAATVLDDSFCCMVTVHVVTCWTASFP